MSVYRSAKKAKGDGMIIVTSFWCYQTEMQKALNNLLETGDRLITVLRGDLANNGKEPGYYCQAVIERKSK